MLIIDMSTISPLSIQHIAGELEQHSVRLLDAPISGVEAGARSVTLSIMVGGHEEDFQHPRPFLSFVLPFSEFL